VRYEDGSYVCSLCGEKVALRTEDETHIQLRHTSGKPTVRVVVVRGKEVHRCPEPATR
jgi:hypothetical protein